VAIIPQAVLFSWEHVEAASDLDRLKMLLEALPDENLMRLLEVQRNGRRDKYPLRVLWNSVLAGIVFEHASIESLRRELKRNAQLRELCGFDLFRGAQAVAPAYVYSRFLAKLMGHQQALDQMLHTLIEQLAALLPDLGRRLAVDSKAIDTHARPTRKDTDAQPPKTDGRRDRDADWGVKTYKGKHKDGTAWEKTTKWFGYKLHLLVDAVHELPLAYQVTKASASDCPHLLPLVEELKEQHPQVLERAEYLSADKGYDSRENNQALYDEHHMRPVIDIRAAWKEEPEVPRLLNPKRVDTPCYTETGEVLCRCRDGGQSERDNYEPMAFEGFEADRGTLKYRCPAIARGITCTQRDLCNGGCHPARGRIVRVPINKDRRIFTPLARDSKSWKREYKHRSAVERVNGRLDVSFGFERHYIRGMKKMRMRAGMALLVMLGMALGWLRAGKPEYLRSLVGEPRAA